MFPPVAFCYLRGWARNRAEEPSHMSDLLCQLSDALAGVVETCSPSVVRVEGRHRHPPASGVAWAADIVVTASHSVEVEDEIEVGLPNGNSSMASVVGRDPATDLAVLKVKA